MCRPPRIGNPVTRPAPLGGEAGFVLPVALVVLVLLYMVAAAGIYSSRNDLRASLAAREAAVALVAADAGASRTIALWSLDVPALPAPGDSVFVDWQTLPDGSSYRSTVFRPPIGPDETATSTVILFTTGQVPSPGNARRTVATFVNAAIGFGPLSYDAAIKVSSRLRLSGSDRNDPIPEVDGTDRHPPGWSASLCPSSLEDIPGVLTSDAGAIDLRRGGDLGGAPPLMEDPSIDPADFLDLGGGTYTDLVAAAGISFTGNRRFGDEISSLVTDGECDASVNTNWGSPLAPSGLCGNYFPVVHVAGNLTLEEAGAGQGVLLVDGDLQMRDNFAFYGLIVVLGTMRVSDDARIYGSILVRGDENGAGRSQVEGRGKILYSSCAVQRAQSSLGGGGGSTGRYWVEVMR